MLLQFKACAEELHETRKNIVATARIRMDTLLKLRSSKCKSKEASQHDHDLVELEKQKAALKDIILRASKQVTKAQADLATANEANVFGEAPLHVETCTGT